ncbi:helix-turn-helix transcriptional regulator [Flavobacterium sp. XN-5]|uniref:helix-turn-helix domain-containing protein n=1 Tax=Flavobacterium sp. XN-5 TaxID=2599390 RepID=UPI0013EF041E|nr:helix-turn-helix transcriptional regulator [Flavobacterium sp. XN-5]NGY38416.1 helix-turn-helix transcriptional regulator [Flavobacterium sp. XN-5]
MLRKIILLSFFLSIQNNRANEINYTKLNAEIAVLNDKNNYEKSIFILENIITDTKSSPYDLYNAYYQKYLIYKSLFNYPQALNNLDLALKAGILSSQKEKVKIQVNVERLIIHFDLLKFDKVTEIIPSISKEYLHYLDDTTVAFYLSILGTMEIRKQNFSKAERYLNEAEEILLKSAPKHLPLIYRKKIGLYRHQKQNDKVIENFKKGLHYAEKHKMTIYVIAMYDDISHFYNEIGDNENAFLAQKKILRLSTEYDALNKSGKLNLIEKDLLQKRKDLDRKSHNLIRMILVVVLVVVLLFLFYYFRSTKHKRTLAALEINNVRNNLKHAREELNKVEQAKINLDNYKLTERQSQIIALVKEGKTNKEIGVDLFISENTVKYHLKIIYETLNIKNRSEL